MTEPLSIDTRFWSARMSYLSRLARMDGLAVVVASHGGYATWAAHNVPSSVDWRPLAAVLDSATGPPQPAAGPRALADGRTADGVLVAPVVWRDRRAAVLVGMKVGSAPGAEDAAAFARVADLVGLELAEAVAIRGRLAMTHELQRSAEGGPQRLLERAIARLGEIFRADGVSIMLADDEGQLSVRAGTGLSDAARRDRKKIGEGISGTVARTGQAVRLAGPVTGGNDATIGEALVAPLRTGDRTIGVVSVKHKGKGERYGEAELRELVTVADDIAGALSTAHEIERANEDRAQAILLYELARLALASGEARPDLVGVTAMLADALHHDLVGLWLIAGDALRLEASAGYGGVLVQEIPLEPVDPSMRSALRDHRTAQASYGTSDERPEWAGYGATHFIVAPLGALGALVLGRATRPYARTEVDFTTTLCDFLVAVLERSAPPSSKLDAPSAGLAAGRERIVAEERKRFAQELHDGLAQELTGLVLALEAAQRAIGKDGALAAKQLGKAERDARGTLLEVRRYMAALRQTEGGQPVDLPVLLSRLVEDLRRQTGLEVEVDESGLRAEVDRIVERALLRVVGEALRNVAMHSGASRAKVSVEYRPDRLTATIQDDGKGFEAAKMMARAEQDAHFGLLGMRERAESLGGQILVRSEPGRGTIVHVTIPFDRPNGTIEDVESRPVHEDSEQQPDPAERSGILGRLLGR